MKSKEALERLIKYAKINEAILITKYGYSALNDINIIKQDLERLNEINNVWHKNEPMECVAINGTHLQEVYDLQRRLFDEIDKLKKVIEILKDKFNFTLDKPSPNGEYPLVYENYQSGLGRLAKILTQQEYKLLKEWFGND